MKTSTKELLAGHEGRRAVLLGGVRTPFAKAGGAFADLGATDLGRLVMIEALARTGIAAERVDQVVFGCAGMPSDAANPARVAALRAGIPSRVPALTVQRNCASGMEAVVQAALLVETGRADVVLCGGMESMTSYAAEFPASFRRKMASLGRAKDWGSRLSAMARFRPRDFKAEWGLLKGLTDPACGLNMGQTAEILAREFGIGRLEQDAFALESHRRAMASRSRLAEEIMPVPLPVKGRALGEDGKGRVLVEDDGVREDQSMERLAKLEPAFERSRSSSGSWGSVTPGNACGITDGACALMVTTEEFAAGLGREPLARIAASAVAGVAPERMGLGPCAALPLALDSAGWTLDHLDLVEINEAFAVQVLACLRVLADATLMARHAGRASAAGMIDPAKLNVNGGAIALGHPVGVSGARLVLTLALELRRRGLGRGGATLCVGGGQGQAVLLERDPSPSGCRP